MDPTVSREIQGKELGLAVTCYRSDKACHIEATLMLHIS